MSTAILEAQDRGSNADATPPLLCHLSLIYHPFCQQLHRHYLENRHFELQVGVHALTAATVCADNKWRAVIYSAGGSAYVAVYGIDAYRDLHWLATSSPIGVASFSGVAISE
jgi:hypothetical protein